ncbi:hypothetical protein J8M97_19325 [Gordonia polyisoprenivorans]|uniref:hypothetical protein n=1 Tax=Gordonia TaxID=2053 RepID=UPI00037CF53C|nr:MULTISPECIES: hypothetical protein [Gordonia]MBE7192132.1 hypothetical protein [Gordonia polyisoprenivorans]MDF3280823.1 hypothetical protein [Gordonia sp. N1V]OPX15853.1 hypothetical protein B1964_07830 [Gordonia sp. i37]QUD81887.1 hypothetical protein J8M97_19325 [Gordonia polyisoprenivorans]UZF57309.1 hypothetical protein LH935_04760 [Gordonia polyisoprenivorans]
MSVSYAVATAVIFVWLGMVIAISFLEAPLKFRAPGITIPLGLGIGRLVFRALNAVEAGAAIVLIVCAVAGGWVGQPAGILAVAVVVVLAVQLVGIRPALNRRSDEVLATGDADGPRSHAHLVYVAAEVVKVGVLIATGVVLLAG